MRLPLSLTAPLLSATLVVGLLAAGCRSDPDDRTQAPTPPEPIRTAVEERIEAINDMRESLARTIDTPNVDKETFQRVCKPVGMRAKQLAQSTGWEVQQLAVKYRNPAHAPEAEADSVHAVFANHPDQTRTWIRSVRGGTLGWRYLRRIDVQPSCLACHGAKDARPDFVKQGYPQDRAYGFDPGDLRGLYAVFVADSLATAAR
jgi:hypothetical protein